MFKNFPNGIYPSGSPTEKLYAFLFYSMMEAFSVIINDYFNNTYAKILVKEENRLYAQVSVGL
jgi:hypothetical protein